MKQSHHPRTTISFLRKHYQRDKHGYTNASSWNSYQRVVSSKCTFTLTTCSLAPSYLFLLWAQVIEEGIEKKVSQQLLLLLDSSWCSYWSIRCLCILCAVIWYYPMKKRDDKMMKDCKLPRRDGENCAIGEPQ